ncbi:unnamed protein product [Cylicocyclus nassatus]|uniref:Catalase core domain-containing protein n=1 Tax=Cylicocyclus nassatus TaxID=53992 RepID=A0AA36H6V6_CYLNA|nr:unnamed protein product [Cylicocyclus nassatus]
MIQSIISAVTGEKSDPSDLQLANYKKSNNPKVINMSNGCPIYDKRNSLTVGPRGPQLMEDIVYLDEITHFDRERIPERVVHAKGAGAHGYFQVTHDITKYTKANLFNQIGKKTPVFMRLSTVALESGSADTVRDPRGFAIKFYTEEGNWDLVANNTPIFFVRDPLQFPNFIHVLKRNPQTHLRDMNALFDFWASHPESTHQVMFLMSDRGTPDGFRHMHGYGSHAFKLINANDEAVWCKFHFLTDNVKNLMAEDARRLAGEDPDYSVRDLYNAIDKGDYPEWTLHIQVMTLEQADNWTMDPFDLTKIWPHAEFPLIPVGKLVLNRNPENYFAEVEQAAFSPSHLVPGIGFSPDKMLQGRILSYVDTQYHRLGPNHKQIPINCPYRARPQNTQRDGLMTIDSQGNAPSYFPDSFNGHVEHKERIEHVYNLHGQVNRHAPNTDDDFVQPREYWRRVLKEDERERLVQNTAGMLKDAASVVQERFLENTYAKVDPDLASRVKKAVAALISAKVELAHSNV